MPRILGRGPVGVKAPEQRVETMRKWRTKELVDETGIEPATFPVGTGTLSRAPVVMK